MLNRLQSVILAPLAGRSDPVLAGHPGRLDQGWQVAVGAGQAAATAQLDAHRNSQMSQCQSDILARDAQEFQAEQRVQQLEQDGLRLRDYLTNLEAQLNTEKLTARAAVAAHKLAMEEHKTITEDLQASVKQARNVIADREGRIQELRTEALQVESETDARVEKYRAEIEQLTNKLKDTVAAANLHIGNTNKELQLHRLQGEMEQIVDPPDGSTQSSWRTRTQFSNHR